MALHSMEAQKTHWLGERLAVAGSNSLLCDTLSSIRDKRFHPSITESSLATYHVSLERFDEVSGANALEHSL